MIDLESFSKIQVSGCLARLADADEADCGWSLVRRDQSLCDRKTCLEKGSAPSSNKDRIAIYCRIGCLGVQSVLFHQPAEMPLSVKIRTH